VDGLALLALAEDRPVLDILTGPLSSLPAPALARFRTLVARRAARTPLCRLTGRKEFHSLPFRVHGGVFAPRFETEGLADRILDRLGPPAPAPRLLDLGTGAGVLALTALVREPALTAWAVDLSPRAVVCARANARALGVEDRLHLSCGDALAALRRARGAAFRVIAANPPYVPRHDLAGLPREVRDHDPRLALDGGPRGLDLIAPVLALAPPALAPGGILLLEVDESHAREAQSLCRRNGRYRRVLLEKD